MVNYDPCYPGTGPATLKTPAHSLEFYRYNTFDTSLKSRSDINLNPQPEGNLRFAGPSAEQNREGVYVNQTDRGELSATVETNINLKGPSYFQSQLQDEVRPTTKETTLYAYDGAIAPVVSAPTSYSQFIPTYQNIGSTRVRTSGAQNFGLRTATEYSYFAGASTTGMNNSVMLDAYSTYKNLYKKPDFNVDGPGTLQKSIPDGSKYQNYNPITKPTTNGLKLHYNLETDGSQSLLESFSPLLGKNVEGIENRYTATYQIAPLFTNPLHKNWNPDNKGELPKYFCNSNPGDYSYMGMTSLPESEYTPGTTSANSYVLGLEQGNHNNNLIEWNLGQNNRPGVRYDPDVDQQVVLGNCYMGDHNSYANNYMNNEFTTLGDPSAGMLTAH